MVYAATLSDYQRVMLWQLIIRDFGPNIQYIAVVDNIVADMLSKLLSLSVDKYKPSISKAKYCAK